MPNPAHFFLEKREGSHLTTKSLNLLKTSWVLKVQFPYGLQPFHVNLLISFWQLSEMQAMINSILPMRKLRNKCTNWRGSQGWGESVALDRHDLKDEAPCPGWELKRRNVATVKMEGFNLFFCDIPSGMCVCVCVYVITAVCWSWRYMGNTRFWGPFNWTHLLPLIPVNFHPELLKQGFEPFPRWICAYSGFL